MMLILSIAVLATVNLGHNIHERVRLQNTADSAAYSMAAMEPTPPASPVTALAAGARRGG
jgi:Flp pilus assembly protein TadG